MPQIKVGIQLASLRLPFRKALQTAARLGATAVEIDARREVKPNELSDTALRQMRKMLEDLNLRVSAITFRTRRGYNVEEELDRRIEATLQALKLAYRLGCNVVVNQVGLIPDDPQTPGWDLLIESLSAIGKHGQREGAFLAARTGAEDPAQLLRLIDALPDGSIGVDFDPGLLLINGFSAREAVDVLGPHIMHVHARDGVRDLAQRRGLEVALGRGSADFPELLGVLEEHRYRGWFTVEREQAQDPVNEVSNAVQFLKNI